MSSPGGFLGAQSSAHLMSVLAPVPRAGPHTGGQAGPASPTLRRVPAPAAALASRCPIRSPLSPWPWLGLLLSPCLGYQPSCPKHSAGPSGEAPVGMFTDTGIIPSCRRDEPRSDASSSSVTCSRTVAMTPSSSTFFTRKQMDEASAGSRRAGRPVWRAQGGVARCSPGDSWLL